MGMEKLFTKSRAERLIDPDVQDGLDEEWERVKRSFGRLGAQTKDTCASILYNLVIKLPVATVATLLTTDHGKKGAKKHGTTHGEKAVNSLVDAGASALALVGRILLATGRATKYGIRRGLAI
jgi:hypothetical protein